MTRHFRGVLVLLLVVGLGAGRHIPLDTWEKGHDEETACRLRIGDAGVYEYSRWSETDDKNPDIRRCYIKPKDGDGDEMIANVVINRDYAYVDDGTEAIGAIDGAGSEAGGVGASASGSGKGGKGGKSGKSTSDPSKPDPNCLPFPGNAYRDDLATVYKAKTTYEGGPGKGLGPNQNAAVLWWSDAKGKHKSLAFSSGPDGDPKSVHTEEFMARMADDIRKKGGKITGIYTELSPCPVCAEQWVETLQDENGNPPVNYSWKWQPDGEHKNCGGEPAKQQRLEKKQQFMSDVKGLTPKIPEPDLPLKPPRKMPKFP
jgi:hypothetical protein